MSTVRFAATVTVQALTVGVAGLCTQMTKFAALLVKIIKKKGSGCFVVT